MPRISIDNYDTVASWNGSQDLFIVEQPDGTKVATPAMVKQFIEAGDFEATGEVKDGHGNILKDMAKSADVDAEIGDLSQTGLTGDSVAEQLEAIDKVLTGSITFDSTQTHAISGLSIHQNGHVVSIQGFISGLVLSSGTVTIGKITGVEAPPITLRLVINSSTQAWTYGESIYASIDTDGSFYIKPRTRTNTVISFSITYVSGTVS